MLWCGGRSGHCNGKVTLSSNIAVDGPQFFLHFLVSIAFISTGVKLHSSQSNVLLCIDNICLNLGVLRARSKDEFLRQAQCHGKCPTGFFGQTPAHTLCIL